MSYETRLRRLEERSAAASREPIRTLIEFVNPDPTVGVVSVLAMAAGMEQQLFERRADETVDELCERARIALGWPAG